MGNDRIPQTHRAHSLQTASQTKTGVAASSEDSWISAFSLTWMLTPKVDRDAANIPPKIPFPRIRIAIFLYLAPRGFADIVVSILGI